MVLLLVVEAQAQTSLSTGGKSWDDRVFDSVYERDHAAFRGTMKTLDATFYPLVAGLNGAFWYAGWKHDEEYEEAFLLAFSEAATLVAVVGIKSVVRRERPFEQRGIEPRGSVPSWDPFSLPSGHAALSFAIATSASLSHPKWYVIVPGYLWAGGMAVSRVWLGVHYPSDVLLGAITGTAITWGIHQYGSGLMPSFLKDKAGNPPALRLKITMGVSAF